jgi:hypothetical protein
MTYWKAFWGNYWNELEGCLIKWAVVIYATIQAVILL